MKLGATAISHGATGKGNDQVRFELGVAASRPKYIRAIAPWREWDLTSRQTLLDYAEKHNIPVEMKKGTLPYSMACQFTAHFLRRPRIGRSLDRTRRRHVALDSLTRGST